MARKPKKKSKKSSLFHQFFLRINELTKYGESRHKYKTRGDGGLSGPTPCIVSKGTRKTYLDSSKRFANWLKMQSDNPQYIQRITVDHVNRYFADRNELSDYTKHTDRSAICKVLGFDSADIPLSPRKKGDITRSRKTTAQATRSAREAARNPELRDFLLATGLRRSEALRLHATDVDLQAGTVHVKRGKGGRSRTVPIRWDMLTRLREMGLPEQGKLFPRISKNMDVHGLRREYAQAVFADLSGGYDYKGAKNKIAKGRLNKICGDVAARLGHGRGRVWVVINHYLT